MVYGPQRSYVLVDLPLLIDAAFAAGAAMISFGAVLGKTSPTQLLWLLVLQVPVYAFNAHAVSCLSQFHPCCAALQRFRHPCV